VLDLYGCDLLDGGVPLVLAEHRHPRGIARDHKLAGTALLDNDELSFESAADLDAPKLLQAEIVTDRTTTPIIRCV
jgi:hypothetical protein